MVPLNAGIHHMSTVPELKTLLQKYSEGRCTAAEEKLLQDWFIRIGKGPAPAGLSLDDQQRMLQDLTRSPRFAEQTKPRRLRYLKSWRSVAAAAIITGIILLGGLFLATTRMGTRFPLAKQQVVFVQVATGRGQVKKVVLPDSSVVWLNARTQLSYHPDFTTHREIRLSGEALFEVSRDEKHPFTVLTADSVQTTVLGTQFNVRSYDRLPETQVTVLSGRVQVSPPHQPEIISMLARNQSIRFDRIQHSYVQMEVNATIAGGWRNGAWELRDQGVAELGLLLYNQYGITLINHKQHLDDLHLDANFTRQQSVKEIVTVFCLLADCQYRWKDNATLELY